jgi:uncharacterized protein (TIGR03435 family)
MQERLTLRNLPRKPFKLKLHHSTKELPIYALVVAKNGPKLKESVDDPNARQRGIFLSAINAAPKPRSTAIAVR